MPTAHELLLTQTAAAFRGRPDMPLMAALENITQPEASWQPTPDSPSIEQLIRHIAWAKAKFCSQAFSRTMPFLDPDTNDDGDSPNLHNFFPCGAHYALTLLPHISGAIHLLTQCHEFLTDCLRSLPPENLDAPLPTHHGKSAAHFFSIMIMHDLYHAGQIRTRRTLYAQQPLSPNNLPQ